MKKEDPEKKEVNPSFYLNKDYNSGEAGDSPDTSQVNEVLGTVDTLNSRGPFAHSDGRVAIRVFILPHVSYIGFLIEETDDSFYVLFLAHFEKNVDQMVSLVYPTSSTITRLLKSTGPLVAMAAPPQVLYYLGLTETRQHEVPTYFTKTRKDFLTNLVSLLKTELKVKEIEVEGRSNSVSSEEHTAQRRTGKSKDDDGKIIVPDVLMSRLVH